MRAVRQWSFCVAVAGLLFASLAATAQAAKTSQDKPAAAPAKAQKSHPRIAPGRDCSDCHKREFQQWEAGPHGVNLVKCVVCHGSPEEGFAPKPTVGQCQGCHAPLLAQLKSEPFMKGKTCFSCHPPHLLKPHQKAAPGGNQ